MAKKVSKGKEKKLLRKAENEKAQQLKAFLANLNEASNLLDAYPAFTRFDRNGLAATLRFYKGSELPPSLLDWAFGLTKRHMQGLYEGCPEWGWSDASKRQELAHTDARYICVFQAPAACAQAGAPAAAGQDTRAEGSEGSEGRDGGAAAAGQEVQEGAAEPRPQQGQHAQHERQAQDGEERPLAFMHFRYEEEEGQAVVYLYEIQIEQAAQGKGLGRFLMQLLELVARRAGVARLMLTVFHGNAAARALYRRLGYTLDASSPSSPAFPDCASATYDILTKWLTKPSHVPCIAG